MRNGREISVANDNKPNSFRRSFDALTTPSASTHDEGFRIEDTLPLELPAGQMLWQPGKTRYEVKNPKTDGTDGTNGAGGGTPYFANLKRLWTILVSACFMTSFAGLIFGLGFSNSMSVITLGLFAIVMTATGFIAVCFLKLPTILKEWAALSIWLVLPVLCLSILALVPEKVALPSAILGLAIGVLSKTKTPLIAAGFCLLSFGYSLIQFEGLIPRQVTTGLSNHHNLGLVLTNLVFLGIAAKLKSRLVLALSLSSAILWGGIWLFSSALSLQAVAAAIFIAGAAQYKLGKAGLDNKTFAAMAFVICGWCLGSLGYLWIQSSYLITEMNTIMVSGASPITSKAWAALTVISICAILVGGMSRHAHSRQSALSILLTTVALGAIPFMVYRPDIAFHYVTTVPGLTIIPAIGFALAAGGVVVFTSMIINGVRLNIKTYIALGVAALGAQIFLLLDPLLWSVDSAVVFGASLFVVAGLLTLFVQSKS